MAWFPGKCRSRGVESNSDPRSLPLPGTTRTARSGGQSRRGGDQVGATAPANAREALEMVRAGLGYLAAADAARLPATTQAECLRELEQHGAMATAARAGRSEEHTSELQSRRDLVCRLLLEKKK